MVDVGGQQNERRKWIHLFEGVSTVLFCVALPDYNLSMIEDSTKVGGIVVRVLAALAIDVYYRFQSRMEDSLEVFQAIVNSRWFIHSSVVLFLNKADIFLDKIKREPLDKYFPKFRGLLLRTTCFLLFNPSHIAVRPKVNYV
jgi:guanine nucleotide-binding protein subunit alpha